MRSFILLAAIVLTITTPVIAQDLKKFDLMTSIREVTNAEGGYLDQKKYDDFWRSLENQNGKEGRIEFIALMKPLVKQSMIFQKATYESAAISIKQKKVIRTEELISIEDKLNAELKSKLGTRAPVTYPKTIEFLEAAVSGSQIESPAGPIYVTQDLVEKVISGIEVSTLRTDRLFSDKFEFDRIEYIYPKLGVKALLAEPLVLSSDLIELPNNLGQRLAVTGSSTLGNNYSVNIAKFNVSGLSKPDIDSKKKLLKAGIVGAKNYVGVKNEFISYLTWRGNLAARSSFKMQVSGGSGGFAILSFITAKDNIISISVSHDDQATADLYLDQVFPYIQILQNE